MFLFRHLPHSNTTHGGSDAGLGNATPDRVRNVRETQEYATEGHPQVASNSSPPPLVCSWVYARPALWPGGHGAGGRRALAASSGPTPLEESEEAPTSDWLT